MPSDMQCFTHCLATQRRVQSKTAQLPKVFINQPENAKVVSGSTDTATETAEEEKRSAQNLQLCTPPKHRKKSGKTGRVQGGRHSADHPLWRQRRPVPSQPVLSPQRAAHGAGESA